MITEKQAIELLDKYGSKQKTEFGTRNVVSFNGLISVIEEYERSKWVRFDIDDKGTWPPLFDSVECAIVFEHGDVLRLHGVCDDCGNWDWFVMNNASEIHWQPLPEFKV